MQPKEIYILRHGQTDYNLKRIVQGRGVDSDINETGQAQAAAFFNYYQEFKFCAVYASMLKRTLQTIQAFTKVGYQIQRFEQLDEINWGNHEGTSPTPSQHKEYKRITQNWKEGRLDDKPQGGESPLEVQARLVDFFENHLYQQNHEKVLLCTHGRTSRILACTLLNLPLSKMHHYNHKNTGLSKVVWNEQNKHYDLSFWGNTDHLKVEE